MNNFMVCKDECGLGMWWNFEHLASVDRVLGFLSVVFQQQTELRDKWQRTISSQEWHEFWPESPLKTSIVLGSTSTQAQRPERRQTHCDGDGAGSATKWREACDRAAPDSDREPHGSLPVLPSLCTLGRSADTSLVSSTQNKQKPKNPCGENDHGDDLCLIFSCNDGFVCQITTSIWLVPLNNLHTHSFCHRQACCSWIHFHGVGTGGDISNSLLFQCQAITSQDGGIHIGINIMRRLTSRKTRNNSHVLIQCYTC